MSFRKPCFSTRCEVKTTTEPEDHLWVRDELADLVRREYDYLFRFYQLLWRHPLVKRVKQGRAVDKLTFERVTNHKRGVVRFACGINESRFRAGDLLRLSHNTPSGHHYEVTWYGEDDGWIGLVFYQKRHLQAFLAENPQAGEWTVDESYVDLQGLYQLAFEDLIQSKTGREQVLPILAGAMTPQVDLASFDEAVSDFKERPMNDSQQEAAAMAVAAHPYAHIQGPPGTGKTRTLAMIVDRLLERGERVLVTALTHRAIHEALNKVCDVVSVDRVAKIGLPVYDPGLVPQDYSYFSDCPLADSGEAYVIGATPFTLWSRRLKEVIFDTVIFDESSQVTPPLAVMAMLKAKRYIFVGDHQQLPPVVAHLNLGANEEGVDAPSNFARLRDQASSTMLTTCYRMNAELCQWPSAQFYHDRFVAEEGNATRQLSWPRGMVGLSEAWLDAASSVVIKLEHDERFTESREEAALVAELIGQWLQAGQTPEEIGVVVPYRRQANRIRRLLRNRQHFEPGLVRKVTVDTVDRFQGSEREAMILSFTASDPKFIVDQAAFLFQPQRLNVAVTRARSKRILLVSASLVETAESLAGGGHEDASVFLSLLSEGCGPNG
jgi:DNA replication ATP-dependent helicase Dna2